MDCIFCKIDSGEIPSEKIYEDDKIFVIKDINPKAETHLLVIAHDHIESLYEVDEAHEHLLGYMLTSLKNFANNQGLKGFRTIINSGAAAGQEIPHLHFHILGGQNLPGFK